MKNIFPYLFITLFLASCSKEYYRFRYIPESEIPRNALLIRKGYLNKQYLQEIKYHVISKQWHDFKDGSKPGVYYITVPN